jgi:hypothetical protein
MTFPKCPTNPVKTDKHSAAREIFGSMTGIRRLTPVRSALRGYHQLFRS